MRIISGKYKGRKIELPRNLEIRPTTDFAREGLFDILTHRINFEEVTVLDLFSGTGFISYEFASRGVQNIVSIDINKKQVDFIRSVSQKYQMPIKAIQGDVFKMLSRLNQKFDIVFCDPPYDNENIKNLPFLVFDSFILKDDGLLIIEHSKNYCFENEDFYLHTRRYGKVHFSFFSKNAEKYFFK